MSDEITGWFTGRLPADWYDGTPEITVDRDQIVVVGTLPEVTAEEGGDQSPQARREAEHGRLARFREDTREQRMRIAREAEHRFGRKVAWGATLGDTTTRFTTLSVPVMTRLRQPERLVLDTLVDAGVARSRSDALAWCVRLVGRHTGDWLEELRQAMQQVSEVRDRGPEAAAG
ncbi:MAG: hypothetical protein JO222_08665 [Frankiales bacterium]|nr:hypothetical protein [Frankiales bacterium]